MYILIGIKKYCYFQKLQKLSFIFNLSKVHKIVHVLLAPISAHKFPAEYL